MSRCALVILLFVVGLSAPAERTASGADRASVTPPMKGSRADFRDRVFTDADGEHRYVVFVPPGYSADRKWPVVLFLHGAGERGHDGRRQLSVGLGAILDLHPDRFPALVVFPQVEETDERILTAWSPENPDGKRALRALAEVEREFEVDSQRRILAGWSMGGYGVWQVAASTPPGYWSSAISVSGGATGEVASRLPPGLPFWAIHGSNDRIVEPRQMEQAITAATQAGRSVTSTIVSGEGHGVWHVVFGRPEVFRWMLDPGSVSPAALDWSPDVVADLRLENKIPERPFHTSTVIQRAVAIRIGNEAFAEFARGVPDAIPEDRLRGQVQDIERSVAYGGASIKAAIRDIHWTAELADVEIEATAAEQLVIRVGLKNLTLRSAGGGLNGGGYRASCGPFDVVLGRRRPVWVEVTTRPRVRNGEIHLTEREISFSIPDDNWFVSEPAWARASGDGLTPELVKVGVVGGMYRSKDRVEAAVRELIPPLIERIERRLVQVPPDSVASLLWPLPTAPPRVRLIPEGIRTDSGGVSVTVGLAVEGPTSSSRPPEIVQAPIREGKSTGTLVGIAPSVLSSVAAMFADDPNARLDLRDLPESPLLTLGDESLLRNVAPGLTEGGDDFELRTVLSLPEPFQLALGSTGGASTDHLDLTLHAPAVLLEVSRRPRDRSRRWEKCLECRLAVTQGLSVVLNGPVKQGRVVAMDWSSEPTVGGKVQFADQFSPSDQTLHGDLLVDAFRRSWKSWTAAAATTSTVDDLAVGGARLRLQAIPVRGGRVWLEFEPRTEPVVR